MQPMSIIRRLFAFDDLVTISGKHLSAQIQVIKPRLIKEEAQEMVTR